jgi:hypothetical protein
MFLSLRRVHTTRGRLSVNAPWGIGFGDTETKGILLWQLQLHPWPSLETLHTTLHWCHSFLTVPHRVIDRKKVHHNNYPSLCLSPLRK